jgi:predicted nicotinamide N-methyase
MSTNESDELDNFDASLFLNLNYTEKPFQFGDIKFNLKILDSASTDYDLTGQVIWPASYMLVHYLMAKRSELANESLLEVGSGTGITGLVAALCSKSVIVTDYNDIVLDLLDHNARVNAIPGTKCVCKKLDWTVEESRKTFEPHSFNIIIGSDVVYWHNMITPLLETVDYLLSKDQGAHFILAFKHRAANTEAYLFEQASNRFKLIIEDVPMDSFVPEAERESLSGVYLKLFKRP